VSTAELIRVLSIIQNLGVPTSRSLLLLNSLNPITFNQTKAKIAGAVLKLAPTSIRFGILQNLYLREKHKEIKKIVDYSIEHYFPDLLTIVDTRPEFMSDDDDDDDEYECSPEMTSSGNCPQYRYSHWFKRVAEKQGELWAHWRGLGKL
jgi:uncharacterized protein YdiU (UPF0061 family)